MKLIRRVNANPYLLDQVYRTIHRVVDEGGIDFVGLEANSHDVKKSLGNCVISGEGYVKAMCEYDAMGVAFEIERP